MSDKIKRYTPVQCILTGNVSCPRGRQGGRSCFELRVSTAAYRDEVFWSTANSVNQKENTSSASGRRGNVNKPTGFGIGGALFPLFPSQCFLPPLGPNLVKIICCDEAVVGSGGTSSAPPPLPASLPPSRYASMRSARARRRLSPPSRRLFPCNIRNQGGGAAVQP